MGGAGDGGVDGIVVNNGRVVAAVQCKWKFDSDPYQLGKNSNSSCKSSGEIQSMFM